MGLFKILDLAVLTPVIGGGEAGWGRGGLQMAEQTFGIGDHLIVIDRSGG